jgi:hypothetical protein
MARLSEAIKLLVDGRTDVQVGCACIVECPETSPVLVFEVKRNAVKTTVGEVTHDAVKDRGGEILRISPRETACVFYQAAVDLRITPNLRDQVLRVRNVVYADGRLLDDVNSLKTFARKLRFTVAFLQSRATGFPVEKIRRFSEITKIVDRSCRSGASNALRWRASDYEGVNVSFLRNVLDQVDPGQFVFAPEDDLTSVDECETESLRLNEDGYIAVPNEGIDHDAFYAHSWEELERLFLERDLRPSDFLIELASMSCHPIVYQELGSVDLNKDLTSGDNRETEPLRLNEDGYIAVPNEGIDHDAFYAHSWEELERLFLERGLRPSDFLIELASMSCHPIVYKELGSLDSSKGSTLGDKSEPEPLRLNEDGYIAVPNEGVDYEAFYAHSWEELERLFRERNLQPSDFLIELASMSCHPIVYKKL